MDGRASAGVVASVDDGGAVGRITLSRPQKLNALSIAVLEDLATVAAWFDERPEVKVVVVAGAGTSFSAGFDLADPSWRAEGADPAANTRFGRAMADAISSMGALTIASIRGHCIGGGVVLAAACDLRVVSDTARFKIPEVDLGVPLYWTGVPRLVRELGPALTKELVLTGRTFEAEEARSIRFANRLVPDAELEAATDGLAAELAAKPAIVIRTTKRQIEEAVPSVPGAVAEVERDSAGWLAASADPEARAVAAAYVASLRRPPGTGSS
jgi:enoyl-CoA hydratase/carnithine racemase